MPIPSVPGSRRSTTSTSNSVERAKLETARSVRGQGDLVDLFEHVLHDRSEVRIVFDQQQSRPDVGHRQFPSTRRRSRRGSKKTLKRRSDGVADQSAERRNRAAAARPTRARRSRRSPSRPSPAPSAERSQHRACRSAAQPDPARPKFTAPSREAAVPASAPWFANASTWIAGNENPHAAM